MGQQQLNSDTRECICHIRSHCVQASHTSTRPPLVEQTLGGGGRVFDKFWIFSKNLEYVSIYDSGIFPIQTTDTDDEYFTGYVNRKLFLFCFFSFNFSHHIFQISFHFIIFSQGLLEMTNAKLSRLHNLEILLRHFFPPSPTHSPTHKYQP